MELEIFTPDDGTPQSAMRSADEVFAFCATLAMAHRMGPSLLPLIKEAQRRLRKQTNPEMFSRDGGYA